MEGFKEVEEHGSGTEEHAQRVEELAWTESLIGPPPDKATSKST